MGHPLEYNDTDRFFSLHNQILFLSVSIGSTISGYDACDKKTGTTLLACYSTHRITAFSGSKGGGGASGFNDGGFGGGGGGGARPPQGGGGGFNLNDIGGEN